MKGKDQIKVQRRVQGPEVSIPRSQMISDNYNSRLATVKIPVFLRGLIDYSGQGGPDGHRSTSEEINGDTKQGKN